MANGQTCNPYIEAIGERSSSPDAIIESLAKPPHFHPSEREQAKGLRLKALTSLLSYFRPVSKHIMFAQDFDMILRAGYEGRDPRGQEARMVAAAAHLRAGTLLRVSRPLGIDNKARSALLAGSPGSGKSLTVEEVLKQYPPVVWHEGRAELPPQMVWMKLDCPLNGSTRSLCTEFFKEADRMLGSPVYQQLYANGNPTEDAMMQSMAVVANIHALGIIVVDEIQHLKMGEAEESHLINFLVTLVNTIGVPLLLIGTKSSIRTVSQTVRLARRAVGLSKPVWDNLKEGGEFDDFVDDLWQYQWTSTFTEIAPEHRRALYDESQGVVDILVKLFMMTQKAAILRGGDEAITPELIHATADQCLVFARDFLAALRSGKQEEIAKYDDLRDFNGFIQRSVQSSTGDLDYRVPVSTPGSRGVQDPALVVASAERDEAVVRELRAKGTGEGVIAEVLRLLGEQDTAHLGMMEYWTLVEKLVKGSAKQGRESKKLEETTLVENDLRGLWRDANKDGRTFLEALQEAGLTGPSSVLMAA